MSRAKPSAAFDLLSNPFVLLRIDPAAGPGQVEEAFGDALSDDVAPEADLQRARQALLTPKLRLEAEVSYLLDVDPATVREILSELGSAPVASRVLDLAGGLHALPRTNLIAHAFARAVADKNALVAMLEAQAAVAPGSVLDAVNDARETAGFVKAERDAVVQALRSLFERQDKAVLAGFGDPGQAAEAAEQSLAELLGRASPELSERLDVFVAAFGNFADPELSRHREALDGACAALKSRPTDPGALDAVAGSLQGWSAVSRPLRTLEGHKGRDDPRSREVYEEIRTLGLWLANEGQHYDTAAALLRAAMAAFAGLPRAAEQMAEDLGTLEGNLAFEPLRSLLDYVETLRPELYLLDADLRKHGFSGAARESAKRLFELFAQAVEGTKHTTHADDPWKVLYGLSAALNEEADVPEGALALLTGALAYADLHHPGPEIRDRLLANKRTIERNIACKTLNEQLKRSRLAEALGTIDGLLRDCPDAEEHGMLSKLRKNVQWEKNKRLLGRLSWAAIILVAIMGTYFKEGTTSSRATYSPPSEVSPSRFVLAPAFEEKPLIGGRSRLLTAPGIRYCLFQRARLEQLRPLLAGTDDVNHFNGMVGDYNSRCKDYTYYERDMNTAQSDLARKRAEIEAEGRNLAQDLPSRTLRFIPWPR